MNITGLWDQLVDCICRPPRDRYTTADLPGGVAGTFKLKGKEYLRKDVRLENSQKQHIECSHLVPKYPPETPDGKLPCVVYCHCNSGSRRDSEEALHLLLPQNVTVFSLDFVGSGQSDGKYVTLGWREQDDLALAIKHLRELGTVSTIGLWGRSMGAVTALLYSQKDPSIAGVVVDSPFSKLTELMLELVEEQKIPIPRSLMRVALSMMRRSVKKRAGFSIDEVAPIDKIHTSFIPVLFGHAREDTFVTKEHSEKLIAKYGSPDKELMLFDGDHNSVRPTKFYGKVLMFFHQALQCQGTLIPDEHNSGSYEVAMEAEAARAAEDMEPPALARTTSPNFSELMSDPSNAQQMQEDLAEELTSQMARRGPHGHADLPSQQHATDDLDELGSVPELSELRQEGQPSQMLTEEAALVRALHLSLLEVQHQEHGHVPGVGAAEPAAAASTALQDTVPQDMQSMAPEDAEEAMLAAAIRASLIEAGEPDTSVQSASATSSHQEAHAADRLEDWQQDSLLVPMPSSSVTRQSAGSLQDQQLLQGQRQQQNGLQQQDQQRWYHQHSQQQQQQQPGHHQQQDMPDGLGVTPGFAAAAYQFGGMAAELQGTAPSKGENQGSFQQGLEQARGMQMRPSWSSSALMQAEYEEAEPLVSAASTPVDGFLHARQKAASQGDLAGNQLLRLGSLAEDEHQLESRGSIEQHEGSPLLARAKSLTSALSSPRRSWTSYIACCMGPDVINGTIQPVSSTGSSPSRLRSSSSQKSRRAMQGGEAQNLSVQCDPLPCCHAGKHSHHQSCDQGQSAFVASDQLNGNEGDESQGVEANGASNTQQGVASQEGLATASAGAVSPRKYPDTKLYQFADIELAHGNESEDSGCHS